MSEEVITDADIEAASAWAHQLAEKIVFGNHGPGNAAVLIDRALQARATAAEAESAKLREVLRYMANTALIDDDYRTMARAALEESRNVG
jgi:hypothetical protein